jgi:hypothetical protein
VQQFWLKVLAKDFAQYSKNPCITFRGAPFYLPKKTNLAPPNLDQTLHVTCCGTNNGTSDPMSNHCITLQTQMNLILNFDLRTNFDQK